MLKTSKNKTAMKLVFQTVRSLSRELSSLITVIFVSFILAGCESFCGVFSAVELSIEPSSVEDSDEASRFGRITGFSSALGKLSQKCDSSSNC